MGWGGEIWEGGPLAPGCSVLDCREAAGYAARERRSGATERDFASPALTSYRATSTMGLGVEGRCMLRWLCRLLSHVRKISIFGFEVEFHPPTYAAADKPPSPVASHDPK